VTSARVIAPVIPPSARGSAGARGSMPASRRLPLAVPPPRAAPADDVVYGLACIDASGRVAERAVITALGWRGGDRLTVTAEAGVVAAWRDPGGMITLPGRPYLVIPAALRRRCGLRAGDRVLLAALPGDDVLAAWPLGLVDRAIRAHGPFPGRAGGTR
jgi:hypothetical protein